MSIIYAFLCPQPLPFVLCGAHKEHFNGLGGYVNMCHPFVPEGFHCRVTFVLLSSLSLMKEVPIRLFLGGKRTSLHETIGKRRL